MEQDPYKVLGVSRDASDDEIKKAYRELSKKYHPDLNPGDESAAKRMSEINAAYDRIQKGDTGYGPGSSYGGSGGYSGYSGSGYGGSSYGGSGYGGSGYGGSGYSQYGFYGFDDFFSGFNGGGRTREPQERSEYQAARSYIRNGMYKEALNALSGVDYSERDARWYYLHAMANYKGGNKVAALESAKRACEIEPENEEYRKLLESIQSGSSYYDDYTVRYSTSSPMPGMSNLCVYGAAAACLSSMCGGYGLPFLFCRC